jgi:hypothetical protein
LLNAWLSTFYHEAPLSDDGRTYYYWRNDYDETLKKYLAFLEKLDNSTKTVKQYKEALDKTNGFYKKYINYNSSVNIELFIAFLFPLIASALLVTYSAVVKENYLPGDIFEIDEWYLIIWTLGITGWFLWDGIKTGDFEFSTGCIGGPIVGSILGVVVYYIFYFIVSIPIAVGGILGALCYYVFKKFRDFKHDCIYEVDESSFEKDSEELDYLAFNYAFSKIKTITLAKTNNMTIVENNKKLFRKKLWSLSIVITLFVTAILYVLISFNPNIL